MSSLPSALQHWGGPGPDFDIPAKLPTSAQVVGGNDENVILLLHCDGDDGSIAFVDSSVGGVVKTIVARGTARIRPAPKFGDGAMYCDGSGAFVEVSPSTDFLLGDFTIDFWLNVALHSSRPFPFVFWYDEDNHLAIEGQYTRGGEASFVLRCLVGRAMVFSIPSPYVPAVGLWAHFAVCRSGDTVRFFVNGDVVGSAVYAEDLNLTGHSLYIGQSLRHDLPTLDYLDGHVDEFRITNDARFTQAFVPYNNEYTMEFSTDGAGRSTVYGARVSDGRGFSGLSKAGYANDGRGSNRIQVAFSDDGRGNSAIVNSFVNDGRGKAGLISLPVIPFLCDGHGSAKVANSFVNDAHGGSVVLKVYANDGRGAARIVVSYLNDGHGSSKIFRGYDNDGAGLYRILATPTYQLFYGNGAPPDLSAAPWQTFAALPFATPPISGAGKHYFVLRRLNQWGLQTQNDEMTVIELDGAGVRLQPRPSGATWWAYAAAAVPKVRLLAQYAYPVDGDDRANQWLIYTKVGSAPVVGVDSPVVVPMIQADGIAKLDWLSGDFAIGNVIYAKVLTRRTTGTARDSDDVAAKLNTIIAAASVGAGGIGVFQSTTRGIVEGG